MFNNYNDGTFKKVTKTTAKKLFEAGKNIYLIPCKACINSYWFSPYRVNKDCENTFQSIVNSFEYYNCNNELGKYTAFYVEV